MRHEFMITITPLSGGNENMGTKRTLTMPDGVVDERHAVKLMHSELHRGLDWLKANLTEEAVHRLLFGLPEEGAGKI
jgi:hypothetical protein